MTPIFDLDGTLVDSDEALVAAFVALGIEREAVSFGHVLGDECARLGLEVADYLAAYDSDLVQPFPGVVDLVDRLDRWAVCSNKHQSSGREELARFGWTPEVALFTDSFGGPKRLGPVLDLLALSPADAVYIGDTEHDRACAQEAGVRFALAAWNPRAAAEPGDLVLEKPDDLREILDLPD